MNETFFQQQTLSRISTEDTPSYDKNFGNSRKKRGLTIFASPPWHLITRRIVPS
jgi:hypothetical protein